MYKRQGLPSATIHRHLGMTGDDDISHLDDYLDADFIIVDEFSMVDTWLANQLLSNISSNSKIPVSYTHLDVYKRQPLYEPQWLNRRNWPSCLPK